MGNEKPPSGGTAVSVSNILKKTMTLIQSKSLPVHERKMTLNIVIF